MTRPPTRRLPVKQAAKFLDRHRRFAAAACAAGAVAAALAVVAPARPQTAAVLASAAELPAGHVLRAGDMRTVRLPRGVVPVGAYPAGAGLVGRTVPLPVRTGEILTDVRLSGSALMDAVTTGGMVGAPVRIADAAAVALLRAGDRIDVLGARDTAATASVVAGNVLVVAVPDRSDDSGSGAGDGGALVVLATTAATAQQLAQAAITSRLSVVLRG